MPVLALAVGRRILGPWLIVVLLFAAGARADTGFPAWVASLHSGSDRLALYSAARTGRTDLLPALLYRTGMLHRGPKPEILRRFWGPDPILNYASNFNGGVPGRTLFGGQVTDESLARSGVVAGGSVYGGLMLSDRVGSTVLLQSNLSAQWLIGEAHNRQQLGIAACNYRHIRGWMWVDGCARSTWLWSNFSDDVAQQSVDLGPSLIYRAADLDQHLSLKLRRSFLRAGPQDAVAADWTGAVANLGAISFALQWAQKLEQTHTTLQSLNLGLRRPGRKGTQAFGLEFSRSGGFTYHAPALLTGMASHRIERVDHTVTASALIPVREGYHVRLSLGRRSSNVDAFDETLFGFNILVNGW